MFRPVPDDLAPEIQLVDIQNEIMGLIRQRTQLTVQAQISRTIGDGEDQIAPIRKAMERNLKVMAAYRQREKQLIAQLTRKNLEIIPEPAATDSVEAA